MIPLHLDANAMYWWLTGNVELPDTAVDRILAASPLVAVSFAAVWELEMKRRYGRLRLDPSFDLMASLESEGFVVRSIEPAVALESTRLPLHHRDPFDRTIVAQAMHDGATLITSDKLLARYDVDVMLI